MLVSLFEKRFNVHNQFTYSVNNQSYEFKANINLINEYLRLGKIRFVSKKRTRITYKLNRCFTADLGLKNQCVLQCEVCKTLQIQKELLQIKLNIIQQNQQIKKLKKPSKIQQILNILKK